MAKLTAEERALLKRLMAEEAEEGTENSEKPEGREVPDSEDSDGAEEFIVFRGSTAAFKKAFGVGGPAEEVAEEETEETEQPKKREPKSRSRSRYFG
ncbi:hypothetical protein ACPCTO_03205 [Streptomyces olivoreticuli]